MKKMKCWTLNGAKVFFLDIEKKYQITVITTDVLAKK